MDNRVSNLKYFIIRDGLPSTLTDLYATARYIIDNNLPGFSIRSMGYGIFVKNSEHFMIVNYSISTYG